MRAKLVIGTVAALAAALAVLLGGAFSRGGGHAARAAAPAEREPLARLLQGFSTGDTAGYVRGLERRVAARPSNGDALVLLGLAYQQRARETGDPTFYSLSERALARAAAARGEDSLVVSGLASLAVSRHRFREALALARRAVRQDPKNGTAYAALGDALASLGRYGQAFRVFDRAAVLAPSVATYARIAYARELLGRPQSAVAALRLALELDSTVPEHKAWTLVQLGNVELNVGRLGEAAQAYREALRRFPSYVHAEAGLARVEAARGRYRRAIALLRHAVEVLPLPQYAVALGDVLTADGRAAQARRAYALVGAIQRLSEANGVRTELQAALFDADHGIRLERALARARLAHRDRPSIDGDDVLAWALQRTGRCREALRSSERALRLGTLDALKFFHRGMIERCLGHEQAARAWFARALDLNPHFSLLWAPVARKALR